MKELQYWADEQNTKIVTKTQGYWVHYKGGESKIDITTGFGAFILGYNHKTIIDYIIENYSVNYLRGHSGETCQQVIDLAEKICSKGQWDKIAWAVSGSDAVESAIAMNDRYWSIKNQNKSKIISFSNSYHGTTMLGKHLRGKYPSVGRSVIINSPEWIHHTEQLSAEEIVLKNIEQTLEQNKDIGCLIMESSTWSGSMAPWSVSWWHKLHALLNKHDVLFVVDDVAVCWGKNGTWFGHQVSNIQPDIVALGKALTGGYSPLGASVCNKKVGDVITTESWNHGHTWQPNMYGILAASAVTNFIDEHNLLMRVPYINSRLIEIAHEFSLPTRGNHLMVAFDFPRLLSSQDMYDAGLCSGIPIDDDTTGRIKIIPPLIADEEYFGLLRNAIKRLLHV